MRTWISALVVAMLGLQGGAARAEGEPPPPPEQLLPPLPPPPPVAAPAPAPPTYFNGPVYVVPATPGALPPPPPPLEVAPPPAPFPEVAPPPPPVAPVVPRRPPAYPYRLGIGGRGGALWTNQDLYRTNLLLSGGGVDLRYRATPRVALDLAFDVLSTNLGDGLFERRAFPVQVGGLFYLMEPRRGFDINVYLAASAGIMASSLTLASGLLHEQRLRSTELLGAAGPGFELRMGRLAFFGDARVIGLYRLNGDEDVAPVLAEPQDGGSGLKQLAVPTQSYGWTFNLGLMLWL